MQSFTCEVCSARLFFGNSHCLTCGTLLGYSLEQHTIVAVNAHGVYADGSGKSWRLCRNLTLLGCTWLSDSEEGYCSSCRLTRTRPSDADGAGLDMYTTAETSKRRLIVELDVLGFPIVSRDVEPERGLAFDLLSGEGVTTGHDNGVITLDLAESDDLYRERIRMDLDEPYRTMLGHFRHEVGHYYWMTLVDRIRTQEFRDLFGDERIDYQEAISTHYDKGAPDGWEETHISKYATMHPWEDFAETFAHFLHIRATLHTATSFGLWPPIAPTQTGSFRDLVVSSWIPISTGLNQINRSMGKDDLYPFVLTPPVLDKLQFVSELVPR